LVEPKKHKTSSTPRILGIKNDLGKPFFAKFAIIRAGKLSYFLVLDFG